jgi:small subunit ribosomal protein S1
VVEQSPTLTHVELGDGIRATCRTTFATANPAIAPEVQIESPARSKPDLSSLSSLLKARWQGNAPAAESKPEPLTQGQIRTFKIVKLDAEAKKIEVELA